MSFFIRKREKKEDYIPDTVVNEFLNAKRENQGTLLLEVSKGVLSIHDCITARADVRVHRLDRIKKGEGALFFYLVIPCLGSRRPPFFEVKERVWSGGELRTKCVHNLVWLGRWNYNNKMVTDL